MTTPEIPTTREALAALLATLPGCQFDTGRAACCGKRAVHGTASHQPTHCAEHTALLGRGARVVRR